jgi:hypothetical protein
MLETSRAQGFGVPEIVLQWKQSSLWLQNVAILHPILLEGKTTSTLESDIFRENTLAI